MTESKPHPPRRVLALADHLGHPDGKVHGGTTYFVNHYPAMARAVDLTVCFMSDRHPAAERLEQRGVEPIFLGRSKWDPRAMQDVARLVHERDIQLVHLHSEKSLILGRLVARRRGIPAVVHIHDAIALKPGMRAVQRRLAQRTDAAVLITEQLRDYALSEHRLPAERIHVVEYGMDLEPYRHTPDDARRRLREEFALDPEAPVIGLVGRVNRDKGQLEMIQAMARIHAHRPDARLLIVGDGPGMSECQHAAAEFGVEDAVIFTGQRHDIPALLAGMDLATMPSMWVEGFGYAALEAIAAGVPVVAFRSGGIPNIVLHEQTGLLVEHGNVTALAEAVIELLDDPARRAAFARAGQAHAQRFSLERHVERITGIYDSLCGPMATAQAAHT